jgi:hypothetical protein
LRLAEKREEKKERRKSQPKQMNENPVFPKLYNRNDTSTQ